MYNERLGSGMGMYDGTTATNVELTPTSSAAKRQVYGNMPTNKFIKVGRLVDRQIKL